MQGQSQERWATIPGHPDHMVSDRGNVQHVPRQRPERGWVLRKIQRIGNYLGLMIRHEDGVKRTHYIHRLVLEAFVGPCPPEMVCRHLDGDPTNNHLSNLRWTTHSEAVHEQFRRGQKRRGADSGQAILSDEAVAEIRRRHAEGERSADLGRAFGVNPGTIYNIVHRLQWKHIA